MNAETNPNHSNDFWQAEVLGQVYETNLSEMAQWIAEGALMPTDKVKRGNLRWIEAQKIPQLMSFFYARENNLPPPVLEKNTQNSNPAQNPNSEQSPNCVLHSHETAAYNCEICANLYCKQCLAISKDCPMCGANCQNLPVVNKLPVGNLLNTPAPREKPDFSSQKNQTTQITQNISYPSDIVKSENKRGFGMFFIVICSLLASLVVAYLWAYQFSAPDKSVEDSLPEIVALDEKSRIDEQLDKSQTVGINSKQAEREKLKKINETHIPTRSIGCTDGMGKEIECSKTLSKLNKSNEDSFKKLNDTYKELNDPDRFKDQTANFPIVIKSNKEQTAVARSKIIENYRAARSKQSFINVFFISFAGIFIGLTTIRTLTKS